MQKVVTITTHMNVIPKDHKFLEIEYPELNKYLLDGYKIVQILSVVPSTSNTSAYSLTFVVEKLQTI